ncbi:MAG: histidine--tRNA ligase [Myxococcales bacterium]|nr:histidine--tRNA ligase [Myxococcales bacterium]
MAKRITPRTLKGFRDYLPQDMIPRREMIRTIEQTFGRHGFSPLDTPTLEYAEILTGKYGDEGDKLLYQFADHGERQVAMRYDLTVPLARVVAQHRGALPVPFRRYHIAPVWRADKPQRGRFREFMQCDVDIVGAAGPMADAEVLGTGLSILRDLGVKGARIHLNHRGLLAALLGFAGVNDDGQQLLALRAIDKWDKVGEAGVRKELAAAVGLEAEAIDRLMTAFSTVGDSGAATLDALEALVGPGEAIDRLREVLGLLQAAGFADGVTIDPTIARGLDYYTGVIYETRLTDDKVSSMGAVMSGGRYDGLIGMFGKTEVPAVGISLGLDRLLAALRELGLVTAASHGATAFVTVFNAAARADAMRVASELRAGGIATEVSTLEGKLAKQFRRADKRGCTLAVVVGPDDVQAGTVVVKHLGRGEQHQVARAALAAEVSKLLAD